MKRLLIILLLFCTHNLSAQDSIWTLHRCIAFAIENNLTIKQSELDKRIADFNLNSSKMGFYPSLNLSANSGVNLGRSINPTTNQFENTQFNYSGLSASSNVLLFGWFQKRYAAQKSNLQVWQVNEQYEQLKEDITLNICTAYLRALLAKEQINNVLYQMDLSRNNRIRIEKLLDAGKSNILELSQTQTQLASDSSLYLQSVLNYEQSLLELQTLLNLDYEHKIVIDYDMPDRTYLMEKVNPEVVYQMALSRYHNIKANEYAIKVAEKDVKITKAGSLPGLNLFYSTGTNYSSSFYEFLSNGEKQVMNFGKQLNTNWSHSIGLGLSIPLFNNFSSRNSIKIAQISLNKVYIASLDARQKLRKDIYTACSEYELTLQKLYNAKSILQHSQKAFNAATIRYESGLIAHFEYLAEKNNYLKAQNELSSMKYELEFKRILVQHFQQER